MRFCSAFFLPGVFNGMAAAMPFASGILTFELATRFFKTKPFITEGSCLSGKFLYMEK